MGSNLIEWLNRSTLDTTFNSNRINLNDDEENGTSEGKAFI